VQDVNKLMKQYEQMHRMMRTLGKGGKMSRLMKGMNFPTS
jgi:signal recognition particle GTPase